MIRRFRKQGEKMENTNIASVFGFMKGIVVTLLVILYVLSPVDLVPGPVDDILLVIFSVYGGMKNAAD